MVPGKLAKHSLTYLIASALSGLSSLLLIPLYTHSLSTPEYGAWELLSRLSAGVMLVTSVGIRQAYIRFYFDGKEDELYQRRLSGTLAVFVGLITILIFAISGPLWRIFSHLIPSDGISHSLFVLALAWIPCEMLYGLGLAHLQIRMK